MSSNVKHQDYFEAIIQLRPSTPEMLSFINNQVNKRKDVFISKIIKAKYGLDIYISSQRFARTLGKRLKDTFKGELKVTRKLYSVNRQTSRQVYRATVLFRSEQ